MVDFDSSPTLPHPANQGSPAPGGSIPAGKRVFPWPFFLALFVFAILLGALAWQWQQANYIQALHLGWNALFSIIPGMGLLVTIGSLTQFKKHPVMSTLSLLLGLLMLAGSCYAIQQLISANWMR